MFPPLRHSVRFSRVALITLGLCASMLHAKAWNLNEHRQSFMGMGLDGINYWSSTPFANAALNGSNWMEYSGSEWGTFVYTWDNPQFDPATRMPLYLNPGTRLRMLIFPMNAHYASRPPSWPNRTEVAIGRVLVEWSGDADIRLNSGTFVPGASNGAATGSLVNGRRTYQVSGPLASLWVEVHAVNAANPPTALRVWLPDPANPNAATLEGQFWHPTFLDRINDMPLRFLRFMDWGATNGSPQMTWNDRRLPTHVTQTGTLNRRAPAEGFSGNRPTGVAYEYMVRLANEIGTDLWICVPHLADETYIRKLARLIRFGSDGVEPYTGPVASPVHPPLNPNLKVYLEYSNEIWSSGSSFPQGNWAQAQANALGISRARFNARKFCQVWNLFQQEFGGTDRLVRVAALFTANTDYNQQFLSEIASYGTTLTPPVTADVASPTTYFGNGIQDWAHQKAQARAGTTDPWFYTTETFSSGSSTRPVTIPMGSGYWSGSALQAHLDQTFAEWKRRIFSGTTLQGGGPDATGVGGGFDAGLPALVQSALGRSVPLISYEGGPSIYTDYLDGSDTRDNGITVFMEALNRAAGMSELYRIQLNMAFSKGLTSHGIFVGPSGSWGKFGQWGQLEFMTQNPATSPRWQELLALRAELGGLRPVNSPLGAVPAFVTASGLPSGLAGSPINHTITTTGGNGNRTVEIIGQQLLPGLAATAAGDTITIAGSASDGGENFLYARVRDADGDAAWRVFNFYVGGGPKVVLESNFEGTNPAQNTPWTQTFQVAAGWSTGGWTRGSGITPEAGNGSISWSQSMPSDEASSTLSAALGANAWWQVNLQPGASAPPLDLRGAKVIFKINRRDFHAPRRYALFTNVGGFSAGQEVFTSPRLSSTGTTFEIEATLPGTPAYAAVSSNFTLRLVGFGGQFSGHVTRLLGFRVETSEPGVNTPPVLTQNPVTLAPANPGLAYSGTLAPYALDPGDTLTWTKTSGPVWLNIAANGTLSGTPSSANLGNNTFTTNVTDSAGQSAALTFLIGVSYTAAAPAASLSPGTYALGTNLTLTTTTSGASIRYTTNGTTPTSTVGTLYTGPFALPQGSYTLRAVAYHPSLTTSPVASFAYEVLPAQSPVILSQPQSQTVTVGANVTLEVAANGTQPLSYQWRRNGQALAGKTEPLLELPSIALSQAGLYDVVVTNPFGTVTSFAANVQVIQSGLPTQPVLSLPKPRLFISRPVNNSSTVGLPIKNLGGANLTVNATLTAFDNNNNYYLLSTNSTTTAGELDFAWRDIVGAGNGGTELTAAFSTANVTDVTLPWAFNFYGGNKTTAKISRFGTIHFSTDTVTGTNAGLPSSSAPRDLIAAHWDDWQVDASASVWWKSDAQEIIVTWNNVRHANTGNRATFQAILFRDGRLRFQYLTTPTTGFSATVGVQNADRSRARQYSHVNSAATASGTAVTMGRNLMNPYVPTGPFTLAPGSSLVLPISVTAPSGAVNGITYTVYVRVQSNDPGRPSEIVPLTLAIADTPVCNVFGNSTALGLGTQITNGDESPTTPKGTLFTAAGQEMLFKVLNNGNQVLNFTARPKVQIVGEHASDFTVIEDLPNSVATGNQGAFRIRFQPQGPGTRRAAVLIENNSSENPFTFAVQGQGLSLLEYWRLTYSLPTAGIGALEADPDNDGLINLLEYALAGHPLARDAASRAPQIGWAENFVGLTFHTIADPDLTYTVEYSENLQTWNAIWTQTGSANQDELLTVTEPEPPSSSNRKFLRLRVTK